MIEIFECEQRTEEWLRCRMGIPTASMFGTVMASGRGGGESKTRSEYRDKLAAEIISDEPMETFTNQYMERGKAIEDEARKYYALITNESIRRVGFVKNGRKGCSPDALVGDTGACEIKSNAPHIMLRRTIDSGVPSEFMPQLQGNLWITEREWIDLLLIPVDANGAHCTKMRKVIRRVYRDEAYISRLRLAVDVFLEELDALVNRYKETA